MHDPPLSLSEYVCVSAFIPEVFLVFVFSKLIKPVNKKTGSAGF